MLKGGSIPVQRILIVCSQLLVSMACVITHRVGTAWGVGIIEGVGATVSFKDIVGATPLWLVCCQAKKHQQKTDFHACVCFIKFVCADDVIQACTFWVSEYARNLHDT